MQELQDIERSVLGSPTGAAPQQGQGHGHVVAGTAALSQSGGASAPQVSNS